MLTSLCTALPARLGLMIIGNEGFPGYGWHWGDDRWAVALLRKCGSITRAAPACLWPSSNFGAGWHGASGNRFWRRMDCDRWCIAPLSSGERDDQQSVDELHRDRLLNHLVEGPMKDPASLNKPSSFPIPEAYQISNIDHTRIHYGLIYGVVACIIAYFLIQRTTFGFAARTAGGNVKAARIAGLPVGKLTIIICFLAGSCAGLAGMVEIAAVQGQANASLVAGYGYAGILVAFVARYNPLAAIIVAVLLGGIINSGGALQRTFGMPDATVLVFQGLVFIAVLYSESLYGRLKIFKEPEVTATPPATSTAVTV